MAMKVTIFNVEHGACSFLRTPTNYTVMIDCGCTADFSPALYIAQHELPTAATWNGYGLTKMIVTHPHDDHITEIEAIKKHCPPALLLRQPYDWEEVKIAENGDYDNLDTYTQWQNDYNGIATAWPNYGMTLDHFWLTPAQAKLVDESKFINNSSIVTVVTVQGSLHQEKFLFGGDMETAGWDVLLKVNAAFKNAVKDIDFFIISHHGHLSGSSEALYAAMGRNPILNIVSIHNNDEHIDPRYSAEAYAIGTDVLGGKFRRMLTTRSDGTITINVTDEGKYWIATDHLANNKLAKIANYMSRY